LQNNVPWFPARKFIARFSFTRSGIVLSQVISEIESDIADQAVAENQIRNPQSEIRALPLMGL
jgi:hypothetical protein